MNNFAKKEPAVLNNLLYTLHYSPVIDAIVIKEISQHTQKSPSLNELKELIKSGKNFIPKRKPNSSSYCEILSETTCVSNVALLKQDKINLFEILFQNAIKLAHSGAYSKQKWFNLKIEKSFLYLSFWTCRNF